MKIRRIDFYPDDWLAGTLELSEFDRGVYITICALIYSRGGSITEKVLQSYCKGHSNAIKPSLARLHEAGKITRLGGVLGQTRARRELDRAETRLRQSRDAGAKGGRPKGLAKPDGYISEKPNNQQPPVGNSLLPPIEPPTESNLPKSNFRSSAMNGMEEDFAAWWQEVPRKVGKGTARRAYRAARKKTNAAMLLAGIQRYARSRDGEPVQYTCLASTWLNGERWADEADTGPNGFDYAGPTGPPPNPEDL